MKRFNKKKFLLFFVLQIAFLAFVSPSYANICNELKRNQTHINFEYVIDQPKYDFSNSKKDLTKNQQLRTEGWLKERKLDPLWATAYTEVAGLASGGWKLKWDFKLRPLRVDQYGTKVCLYFEEINLDILYRTIIYIPKNYPVTGCSFEVVKKHELEHHIINGMAVEQYITQLERDMQKIAVTLEGKGYVASDKASVERRAQELKQGVQDAVDVYIKKAMIEKMQHNNAKIDTQEEYTRLTQLINECGDEKKGLFSFFQ
jgi:hypothetical protein